MDEVIKILYRANLNKKWDKSNNSLKVAFEHIIPKVKRSQHYFRSPSDKDAFDMICKYRTF